MRKVFIFIGLFFIGFSTVFASNKFKVTLDKCVDGDTAKFVIDGEVKTVRFLSINTPELAHFGNDAEAYGVEASEYTCNALTNAKSIKLQYDPKSDETDKYGRVLAWVFVDNELLQEKLIKEGLAEVKYVYDDYLYTSDLQALEVNAQESKLGMWSDSVSSIVSNDEDGIYELIASITGVISVIIVALFSKNSRKKKKAIKDLKKMANI